MSGTAIPEGMPPHQYQPAQEAPDDEAPAAAGPTNTDIAAEAIAELAALGVGVALASGPPGAQAFAIPAAALTRVSVKPSAQSTIETVVIPVAARSRESGPPLVNRAINWSRDTSNCS